MKKEDQQMLEKIFDTEKIGHVCLYPNDGSVVQESVIATTPENLAAYVGSHLRNAEKMVVTDMCDRLILDTCGFINNCPDQNLCIKINTYLSLIQMGDRGGWGSPCRSQESSEGMLCIAVQLWDINRRSGSHHCGKLPDRLNR